jgi:predicted DNA-binding transcriptional regulator YafY
VSNQTVYGDAEIMVQILYTNHRGETAWRKIRPKGLWFGTSDWHPEEQWFLCAVDVDRGLHRTFAMDAIKGWRRISE